MIPVDLFGLPADYRRILPIAEAHGLKSAGGWGPGLRRHARWKNGLRLWRRFHHVLFPAKPLGCYGDGGAVFTDDDTLAGLCSPSASTAREARNTITSGVGLNSRLDTPRRRSFSLNWRRFPHMSWRRARNGRRPIPSA